MVVNAVQYIITTLLIFFAQQGQYAIPKSEPTGTYLVVEQIKNISVPTLSIEAPTIKLNDFYFFEEEDVESDDHTTLKNNFTLVKKGPFCIGKIALTMPPMVNSHSLAKYDGRIKCTMQSHHILNCTYLI
jgi:hypothetical protein